MVLRVLVQLHFLSRNIILLSFQEACSNAMRSDLKIEKTHELMKARMFENENNILRWTSESDTLDGQSKLILQPLIT